ncbi:hypothetical protein IPM09_00550 [Candidatus Saccharibacteria bacterium]|nr:MAG: hypothetical protein IPM09_00550 [Candidatus Saccharibacteria bacterium]
MGDLRSKFNAVQSGIIHSSGFAKVADGNTASFGASSTETFSQRLHTEHNRQHIQSFGNAGVLHGYRMEAKAAMPVNRQGANLTYGADTAPLRSGNRASLGHVDTGSTRQSLNARGSTRLAVPTRFKEPTPRHYNPYD